MTGPAIENICAAVPSTKPSCFHSPPQDEISHNVKLVRPLEDDEVDRAEVEVW